MISIEEVKGVVTTEEMIDRIRELVRNAGEEPAKEGTPKTRGIDLDMIEIEQMTLRLLLLAKKYGIEMSICTGDDGSLAWARVGAYEFTVLDGGKTWDYSPLGRTNIHQDDVATGRITSFTDPPRARTD
ncbi:MAG: hypothetical protein LUI87_02140 [Lachnospiraceae bacterium]|nr:hypothetical protein [Lachnospiraceae bacterium]